MPRAKKYTALSAYLAALPANQEEATLTLAQIETIIGSPLPLGAWTSGFWTSPAKPERSWRAVGFRARFDRHAERVAFTRTQP